MVEHVFKDFYCLLFRGFSGREEFATPAPTSGKKKRKLCSMTPQQGEVFTPPEGEGHVDSPHSTVKRQLRTRRQGRVLPGVMEDLAPFM